MNNKIEKITNNLEIIGACWDTVEGKNNGTYNIQPDAKNPYEHKIIHFSSLTSLENWIQLKKELLKLENKNTTYADSRKTDILQELSMLESGVE
ncbi:hypothetical protein FDC62_11375 [Clostridium botulinum]|nr:hypothetical protein [Clostridium botulinum]MCD3337032.1 hypothetical protein [Clostridium botulinum D/C]MCD3354641.1 hypothetical protein [Clostridium botulinum D/C]NFO98783.1 hypothetical protein [Clostridium botulinum]OOV52301.1 hypothetical protein B1A66_04635 [Clostridium botulinum D/C]OOV54069.1 hypothetical protein B0673_11440 [Clostridium botulinum D/C]